MDIIAERAGKEKLIVSAFNRRVLKQHAEKMQKTQNANVPVFSDSSLDFRNIATNDDSLIYRHKGIMRMIDMKRLTRPFTTQKYNRKPVYNVHNRIIMGHYAGLSKDLTFGLTDAVRQEIMSELDGKQI
ncbi:hypothetical protein [Chryseobacterium sp. Hurlbut01]|uniref:hypothetical protein n=1 Tax=Chryseobacterium sp. Hurlbut01 TaxID=1681828 RepID=UPI00067B89AD|nr:hypothetical protein [Chryseobacterium sp. Hurlbut01]KNB60978.1 hypothetical protein AC804_17700 [Chryseobacterium sp. Hurlbut01]